MIYTTPTLHDLFKLSEKCNDLARKPSTSLALRKGAHDVMDAFLDMCENTTFTVTSLKENNEHCVTDIEMTIRARYTKHTGKENPTCCNICRSLK